MLKFLKISLISLVLALGILNPLLSSFDNIDNLFGFEKIYANETGADTEEEVKKRLAEEKCKKNNSTISEDELTKCINKNLKQINLKVNETQKKLIDLLLPIIEVLVVINWYAISLLSILMDNVMVYHPGIVDFLHDTWLVFRNIANTVFAIALIALALKNIFSDMSTLGSTLGKFVLALVFVNFSWFAVKVIVDVGTVTTNIIYRLPNEFGDRNDLFDTIVEIKYNYNPNTKLSVSKKMQALREKKALEDGNSDTPETILEAANHTQNAGTTDNKKTTKKASDFNNLLCIIELEGETRQLRTEEIKNKTECSSLLPKNDGDENKTITEEESMLVIYIMPMSKAIGTNKQLSSSSIAGAIGMNFLPLEEFNKLSSGSSDWSTLTFEIIFSIIFVIMSAIVFVAVAITMLERLIVLWLMIVMSPFAALAITLEDLGVSGMSFSDMLGKLVNYAIIIPAGIGLVFALTFVMIGQLYYIDINDIGEGNVFDNMGSAWTLILGLATLGILWVGSFSIMEKAEYVAKTVTGSIQSGVQSLAQAAGSQLLYIPIIPMGKTLGGESDVNMSFGGLNDMFQKLMGSGLLKGESKEKQEWFANKSKLSVDGKVEENINLAIKGNDKLSELLAGITSTDQINSKLFEKIQTNLISDSRTDFKKKDFEGDKGKAIYAYVLEKQSKIDNTLAIQAAVLGKTAGTTNVNNNEFNKIIKNDNHWNTLWGRRDNTNANKKILAEFNRLQLNSDQIINKLKTLKADSTIKTPDIFLKHLKRL